MPIGASHRDRDTRLIMLAAASPALLVKFQPEVTARLTDKDREVRITAAHALASLGEAAKPAVPVIAKLLTSKDSRERYQVTEVIVKLGPIAAESVPQLVKQLDQLENGSANGTLTALIALGPSAKSAVPKLLELAKSTNQQTKFHRPQILEALGAAGADAGDLIPIGPCRSHRHSG